MNCGDGHRGRLDLTLHHLRTLLARWVKEADAGWLDGVPLDLMVESEAMLNDMEEDE